MAFYLVEGICKNNKSEVSDIPEGIFQVVVESDTPQAAKVAARKKLRESGYSIAIITKVISMPPLMEVEK